ncbi:MAG: hypothetical protein WBY94_28710 [Polyangiaceae bacterium]
MSTTSSPADFPFASCFLSALDLYRIVFVVRDWGTGLVGSRGPEEAQMAKQRRQRCNTSS